MDALRLCPRPDRPVAGRVSLFILALLLTIAIAITGVRAAPTTATATPLTIEHLGNIGGGTPAVALPRQHTYAPDHRAPWQYRRWYAGCRHRGQLRLPRRRPWADDPRH